IRVKSENLEWAQWLDQVLKNHNFDLTIVSHTEPMDYDIYGRPDYYFGYQNPEFNRLLAAQDAATDPRQQLELLAAIQRKLSDDAVNAWLFQFPRLGVWRADVRGLWPNSPIQADNVTGAYFEGAQTGGALAAVSRAGSSRAAGWIALGLGLIVLLLAGRKVGARYLAARSGYLIATLIGATLVVFALTQVVPGDPASFMMGLNANPQAVAALRHQLGVDQPIPAQYFHWVSRLLHGDFGTSYTYRVPVAGLIAERLAVSGPLALYAMLLSVLVGVPIGVLAAARRNSAADTGLMALSQIGVATPNFWLAMLLVLSFSMGLRWFSAGGFAGWDAGLGAGLKSLTLPAVALALPQAAIIARVLRSALIEAMGEDYVRTARAKGLSRGQALRRHALRNALVPLLSILGLQFPFLLAGSVIIENVFFLPGIGRLVFQAIVQRDLIVVQSVVMVLVLAVVLVTFLVDIGYAVVDPRLRGRRTA
ncbi:MAG: ABC transporter permease subunit, partial [Caulobacteraceae bacterium]